MKKATLITLYLAGTGIAACLCVVPAAWGQSSRTGSATQGSNGAFGVIYIGHGIPLLPPDAEPQGPDVSETPQQVARRHQEDALTMATARALKADRYADAEGLARQSLGLDPSDSFSEEQLAQALIGQGRSMEALRAYRLLVNPKGDWSVGLFSAPRVTLPYALLALQYGQWAEAVTAYEKAIPSLLGKESAEPQINVHFDPHTPQPAALEAAIHIALGLNDNWECDILREYHNNQALAEYRRALQLEPEWDLANFYYGYGLNRLGRRAEAKTAFAKAAQLGGDDVKAEVAKFSK